MRMGWMRMDEGNGDPSYTGNVFLTPEKEVLILPLGLKALITFHRMVTVSLSKIQKF